MQLHFCEYEAWMKNQVVDMFCEEYGNDKHQFVEYFDRFYSSYQQDRAIRLVILEERVVAGFVSFSYWPYFVNGQRTNSYQCGNVIINKNYRGKGLYNQLLNYLNENASNYNIDFIIGFPIKQILKLYLKSNWKNPFNLNWYIKVINPIGRLFPVSDAKLSKVFSTKKNQISTLKNNAIVLSIDEAFYTWNEAYNNLSKHYYFEYAELNQSIEFSLKINKRKYVNELIVGEVNTNSTDAKFIDKGIKKLINRSRRLIGVSMLSLCMNDHNSKNLFNALAIKAGFKKIDRDIKFVINNFKMNEEQLLMPENWELYRRDIDTW
jgi:hypothetical protein